MTPSTVELKSGQKMPLVGFGLWKVPIESAADTVYNVRHDIQQLVSVLMCITLGNQSRLPSL